MKKTIIIWLLKNTRDGKIRSIGGKSARKVGVKVTKDRIRSKSTFQMLKRSTSSFRKSEINVFFG